MHEIFTKLSSILVNFVKYVAMQFTQKLYKI